MIKRKFKQWHLSDFTETAKFMYIVLEKDFHDKFYSTAIKIAGGQRKLAQKLGFYSSRINNYLYKNRRPSLDSIKKISNFLVLNGQDMFNMNELEKHIKEIKVNGQPISIFPIFPIQLNEDLVRIIAHLIGDGGINKFFDPHYSNSDKILLNNFQKYMEGVFGCKASRKHGGGNRIQIWYPRIIGKMLIEMLGKFSFGRNPKYIPEDIFDIDKNLKTKFLNSLYGDEGSSPVYQVTLYQGRKNLRLLEQTRLLLKELDIKTNDILKIKDKHIMTDPHTKKQYPADEMYVLAISGYREIMKFKDLIGFPENSDKNKNFLNMVKTKYNKEVKRNKVGETKNLILENISSNPKTIKELCSILGFSKEMIYRHIKELKCQDKISFEQGLIKAKR